MYYGLIFDPFFLLYGSTLMIVVMLGFFCSLVQLPIFIAKTRNISAVDITVVKILSWVGIIIHLTWIIALLIACFREPVVISTR
jgi:hypothetical protein